MEQTLSAHTTNYQIIDTLRQHLNQRILGQETLIDRMLIALLCDGHLLVEGAPGLAKTRAIKEMAMAVEGSYHRLQFTPDLLPGDVTGTDIFHAETAKFSFQAGPIFHNLVLADEINRAPAKVQSALLEAMGERQVTVGQNTYQLPKLFLVMATQNPIEQEGTYPLPEAQLDRFLMYVRIHHPDAKTEKQILALTREEARHGAKTQAHSHVIVPQQTILNARQEVLATHLSPALEDYLIQLVIASRNPKLYGDDLKQWLDFGASPRASIALDRCARAHAWLENRDYVAPDDIRAVAFDVLRHRILLSFTAEAEGITPDHVINEILNRVVVP